MDLLFSHLSPFARKVRVLLRESGQAGAVAEVPVSTTPLNTAPEVAAANPTGRIPVLIRPDGPALYDSRVICRYLDDRFTAGLYPATRLWEVLTLEALADGMTDSAVQMRYEVALRPAAAQSPAWLDAQWAKIARGLDSLGDLWLPHLAGPVDMGQVAVGCMLGYVDFRHSDRDWRTGREALAAWYARFAARPAMAATAPG
jgi:glutathione S-transferase